uniref:Uncharacterized protein n=1 Tax=Rhizophora mucronata TaxID=61149 RepID=A0A2P2N5K6_RHIMU
MVILALKVKEGGLSVYAIMLQRSYMIQMVFWRRIEIHCTLILSIC